MTFTGSNFGISRGPVSIVVGGLPCDGASWLNDGAITCTLRPDVVGAKNVTILAANRSGPVFKDTMLDPKVRRACRGTLLRHSLNLSTPSECRLTGS